MENYMNFIKKLYSVCAVSLALLCSVSAAFSQEGKNAVKDFVKENISGKTRIVKNLNGASKNFAETSLYALNFLYENYDLLSSDEDFIAFALKTVKSVPASSSPEAAHLLEKIFAVNKNAALQNAVLENFTRAARSSAEAFSPDEATVALVNSYAADLLKAPPSSDSRGRFISVIDALAQFRRSSSFPVLFSCYSSSDTAVSEKAAEALNNFSGVYENSVRSLITGGSLHEKKLALDLVLQNPQNSDFFKAEMSENVLSSTIYKAGDVELRDKEYAALKMQAIRELYRVSWTRSAPLMRDVFVSSRKEYEAGLLTDNQFVEIIYAFTRLAPAEAAENLTNYLKALNKNQEENKPSGTPIVLAVIQSLQLLRDKIAFDDLLYATYQNYPDEVISAARDALSKLKW